MGVKFRRRVAKKNKNLQSSVKNCKIKKIKDELSTLNLKISSIYKPKSKEIVENIDEVISNLMEIIAIDSKNWDSLQLRNFSVLLFSILSSFEVKRNKIEFFLNKFNLLTFKNCEIHFNKISMGDFSSMYKHGRGGKREQGIYDFYPELEDLARSYAWSEATKKVSNFNVKKLVDFITEEYKKISGDDSLKEDEVIRSISSCRNDLIRWGCLNDENKMKPYSDGHEEPETVEYREKFISELINN